MNVKLASVELICRSSIQVLSLTCLDMHNPESALRSYAYWLKELPYTNALALRLVAEGIELGRINNPGPYADHS